MSNLEINFKICSFDNFNKLILEKDKIDFINLCGREYKIINFLKLFYVNSREDIFLFVLINALIFPYIIFLLKHLCEQHLAHLVPIIGQSLSMGKQMSSIILVALIVTYNNLFYIVTSDQTDHGYDYLETGFILYTCFIGLTVTFPICIIRSKNFNIYLNDIDFLREIIMIFIALSIIFFYACIG